MPTPKSCHPKLRCFYQYSSRPERSGAIPCVQERITIVTMRFEIDQIAQLGAEAGVDSGKQVGSCGMILSGISLTNRRRDDRISCRDSSQYGEPHGDVDRLAIFGSCKISYFEVLASDSASIDRLRSRRMAGREFPRAHRRVARSAVTRAMSDSIDGPATTIESSSQEST
ncbi:MAG: hypothetical protein ACKOBT_02020, partial [Actinomycetota bacterium]